MSAATMTTSWRLVQIRDLMAGQGWFDLTQYRLGLDGGTLMHWSRLIDVPIANLIGFFSLFMEPQRAEAATLFAWLLLLLPLFAGVAIAAKHLGGRHAMLIALPLTALFALTQARFQPGAIDHHNVQMVLIKLVAAGLAVAVGAETRVGDRRLLRRGRGCLGVRRQGGPRRRLCARPRIRRNPDGRFLPARGTRILWRRGLRRLFRRFLRARHTRRRRSVPVGGPCQRPAPCRCACRCSLVAVPWSSR